MSSQGLKHAGDTTNENKPGERRRGAAGRAAALRRAPSDSDCSGETASLSADSGERRPAPPPPRAGKTRGRRRGSEWEVLEGLKDGQRFERRPEVFNGYLHKKRKWPLKGWHKRFFVVDGGILVYARSPTDVARGRLHGSLDVGLSVISAKPRRRRIDIDADEFIYHLRAKTPDVFRTWLNVLKAHRLYRQHLLTFGARESVPKVHAPLDELPPTDTSSHVSHSSAETFSTLTNTSRCSPAAKIKESPTFYLPTSRTHSSIHENKSQNVIEENSEQSSELDIKIDTIDVEKIDNKLKIPTNIRNGSLCSMCCVEKRIRYNESTTQPSQNSSLNNDEKQVHSTNLDIRALKSIEPNRSSAQDSFKCTVSNFMSTLLGECNLNPSVKVSESPSTIASSKTPQVSVQSVRKHLTFGDKSQTTLFFFSRKNRNRESADEEEWTMKRSRKSTNVFKYRNSTPEPLLKRPISKCMLLAKYKLAEDVSERQDRANRGVLCDLSYPTSNKSVQDVMSPSEYDGITEKLILTIFGNHMEEVPSRYKYESPDSKFKGYVNQVVKELYSVRQCQSGCHPVTYLFRSLLDYYLKNTGSEKIKQALQKTKSVPKQSNKHFTKDAMISSEFINSATKETQVFEKRIEVRKCENATLSTKSKLKGKKCYCEKETSPDPTPKSPKGDTDSFEKERRIQELERLMKNTVYLCETVQSLQSKENDIKITKTLINNLSKMSKKSVLHKVSDDRRERSDESTELPAIQDTINRLISETEMPPEMAKEFLNMYLDVLCDEGNKPDSSSSRSSDTSKSCRTVGDALPSDGVQTESVIKKISKSVTAGPNNQVAEVPKPSFVDDDQNKQESIDPGQLYLQEMLDEITTVFTQSRVHDSRSQKRDDDGKETMARTGLERSRKSCAGKSHVYEVKEDNSVVIDLSKYDLHRISMVNDAASARMITVKIKLKEKPADYGEWKHKHLSLKFSNDHPKKVQAKASTPWPRQVTGSSKQAEMRFINMQAPYIKFDPKDQIELKPYISTSDATSKGNPEALHGSDYFNLSGQSSETYPLVSPSKMSMDSDNAQSFLLSSLRKRMKLRVKSKKQLNNKPRADSPYPTCPKPPDDGFTVFEKEPPGIIDERFILLLLENLALLSKNLPEMYKEIGSVYLKLKKRHDQTNKDPNSVNVSLLEKNCKEPSLNERKLMFDGETQYDACDFPDSSHHNVKEAVPVAVNTSVLAPTDNVIDKSVSAYELPLIEPNQKENKVIENNPSNPNMSKEKSIETQTSYTTCLTTSVDNSAVHKDQAISIQEWCNKLTQECAISTVIKCFCDTEFLDFATTDPQDLKNTDTEIVLPKKFKKKQSDKLRQDLIQQIKLLSSSFKVSTQSQTQTEKKLNRHAHCFEKDFRVYQLFPKTRCKMPRSGSATDSSVLTENKGKSDDLKTIYRCSSVPSYSSGLVSPTAPPIRGPQAGFVSGTPGGRLASWIIESGGPLESASRELGQAQLSVQQLQRLLDALELQQQLHHDTDVSLEGASPNVKKDRRKFGLRKKKSNNKCGSVDLAPAHLDPSSSQMALSTLTAPPSPGGGASSMPNSAASLPIACAAARPQSLPGAEALATGGPASLTSLTPDHQLREDFTVLAKDLVASLKTILSTLVCERGRLRAAMDAADPAGAPGGAVVAALRTNLSSALQQNSELRSRLSRIHDASDLAELSSVGNHSDPQAARQFPASLSYSSSCVSASEFFDAEEHDDEFKPAEIIATDEAGVIELDGDSSSEAGSLSSEEGSASSDNSDGATSAVIPASRPLQNGASTTTPRRARLPCPRPTPASPSLWNLLYKNIGKDLSQISMPVTINEPLNMLQRLCEELEYSELLDAASECSNEIDRMSLIAAFAVSAYAASAHRAASKPFNPLLGETYECIRPDRDFRFIAEQVSHHPPISACHAESPRWTFWQEARIKTKFWGKSMEFQPAGRVHVRLAPSGDHYSWNKVTTCVHNLFGGQRWVDQYGDMHIVCHGTDITCKLNFVKASAWSGSRHEVRGAVMAGGAARARLQGRWSDGLHAQDRPLWRPGAMPADYELYYGFTRFAMELNELEPGMREILPNTDTRLRPDQRALEEGDVDAAEQFKLQLEQAQRERRRDGAEPRAEWFRKSVEEGEETWVFTGEYWKAREAGFGEGPRLW